MPAFKFLVQKIKYYPGLQGKRNTLASPELHLLTTLNFFGSEGNGADSKCIKEIVGVRGKGSVKNYIETTVDAILSLEDETLFWPDADERKEIGEYFEEKYGFAFSVGVIDGALLDLYAKPLLHGEDYFTRKNRYSVQSLVICDHEKRIRYLLVGWPGCVHDNRMWESSKVYENMEQFFSELEYLLGDSAFTATPIVVPAYKRVANQGLETTNEWFNNKLASPRVIIEHTIGIWKGRFPYMRNMRVRIGHVRDLRRIIRYAKATAILHNLLIKVHKIPDEWEANSDSSSSSSESSSDTSLAFIRPLGRNDDGKLRRQQVHAHLLDHFGML